MFLRDPARIEVLMACQFIALLIRALGELLVRRSIVDNAITDVTIYPEDRPRSAPSAKRILEPFKGVTRDHLIDGEGTS